jgi:dipeptidyl aminopeptidase/acylaminoacyl peptidase
MYEVARYLSIDTVESPTFTADGDLLFLADTTGTPQVWRLEEPGAWPERLTPYEERVSFVDAAPDDPAFVFGMDEGGNERDQLYRYHLEAGSITQLTDQPDAMHDWGAWSSGGDRLAYTANRRDTEAFDAYVQPADATAEAATCVWEGDEGWLTVEAWGPNDRLVIAKPAASLDVDLSLLDPDTGERRRLSDEDEPAFFGDIHFGPVGDRLYLVTDYGADKRYLGRVDLDTGEIDAVVESDDWDIDGFALDRRTGRIVYSRNVDGFSEVHSGYLDRGEFRENTAPAVEGIVEGLTFDAEGNHYAFVHASSDLPFGINVAEFGTDLQRRWTRQGTCGIPMESFRDPEVIHFETFDGREIPAYWTLPEDADSGETPVIVDIHGGPEHQRRPWFYPVKQYFLNRGYAVFEPNVRGSTGYGREYAGLDDVENRLDPVRDIKHGVEWLTDQAAVDPDRIVAYGRSYGGFMVLSSITQYPDLWAAAVDFVGIADFETFLENTGEWRRSHREAEYGSLADDRDLFKEISPIHDVDEIECPLFIQHGANDPRVPVGEAQQIADALEDRGVPVETLVFEDEGHHTTTRANLIKEFEAIAAFLDEHV